MRRSGTSRLTASRLGSAMSNHACRTGVQPNSELCETESCQVLAGRPSDSGPICPRDQAVRARGQGGAVALLARGGLSCLVGVGQQESGSSKDGKPKDGEVERRGGQEMGRQTLVDKVASRNTLFDKPTSSRLRDLKGSPESQHKSKDLRGVARLGSAIAR